MVRGPDGVTHIYPSLTGGESWYLADDPDNDNRFNVSNVSGNSSDGFKAGDSDPRMSVETSTGFSKGSVDADVDHSFIASRGYMWKANDWKNVEITGYFKVGSTGSDTSISEYARGANHTSDKYCPGCKYTSEIGQDGKVRWAKEQWHVSYTQRSWESVGLGSLSNHDWFGFKTMYYNVDTGDGKLGVKMETWFDLNNDDTWVKKTEYLDKGGWGSAGKTCGGSSDQILIWGGPLVTFRFDDGGSIKWKKLSVREINPGGQFIDPTPGTGGSGSPVSPQTANEVFTSRHLYRVGVIPSPTCEGETIIDPTLPPPDDPPPSSGLPFTRQKKHANSWDHL